MKVVIADVRADDLGKAKDHLERFSNRLHSIQVDVTDREAMTRAAATEASRELRFVWNAIRVQTKYKHDDLWSPEEFDVYRWLVARHILNVQEALAR